MLVLKHLVGLHRPSNFSFFSFTGWDIGLDYHDIEWFALETNRYHSIVFEIASKYCLSDSFVALSLLALSKIQSVFFYCLIGLISFFPFPVQLLNIDVSLEFARKIKLPLKIIARLNNSQ